MGVIYSIKSQDKFYIGSTKDFNKRMAEHRGLLENGKHSNDYMQRVFNKYNDFEYVIIEEVDNSKLKEVEQLYIDKHYDDPNCMNGSPYAHRAYNPWTEESRKKLSETCKGRKHTDEAKRKMSDAKKGKVGGTWSKPCEVIWNDTKYEFVSLTDFMNTFTESARCIYRRLTKNADKWITLTHVKADSNHPFSNGDKLLLSWKQPNEI